MPVQTGSSLELSSKEEPDEAMDQLVDPPLDVFFYFRNFLVKARVQSVAYPRDVAPHRTPAEVSKKVQCAPILQKGCRASHHSAQVRRQALKDSLAAAHVA